MGRTGGGDGPPDSVISRPDGGSYLRPAEEGGGITSVYPFEKWRYRFIEGLGPEVELEFRKSQVALALLEFGVQFTDPGFQIIVGSGKISLKRTQIAVNTPNIRL